MTWNGRRADVLDAHSEGIHRRPDMGAQSLEPFRPLGVVVDHDDLARDGRALSRHR